MTLRLKFVREARSHQARLYENGDGARLWIPRSVCPHTMKWSGTEHEVDVEDWWLEKNPWPANRQRQLI
jgi:hypothetical protein